MSRYRGDYSYGVPGWRRSKSPEQLEKERLEKLAWYEATYPHLVPFAAKHGWEAVEAQFDTNELEQCKWLRRRATAHTQSTLTWAMKYAKQSKARNLRFWIAPERDPKEQYNRSYTSRRDKVTPEQVAKARAKALKELEAIGFPLPSSVKLRRAS